MRYLVLALGLLAAGHIDAALAWTTSTHSDQMGSGDVRIANVQSSNSVEFAFPYTGRQYGRLQLRVHPKYGKDVILSVERGQFLCMLGCNVSVRFDEGKAQTFS